MVKRRATLKIHLRILLPTHAERFMYSDSPMFPLSLTPIFQKLISLLVCCLSPTPVCTTTVTHLTYAPTHQKNLLILSVLVTMLK